MTQREINLHIAMERLKRSRQFLLEAEELLRAELRGSPEKMREVLDMEAEASIAISRIYVITQHEVGT